MDRFIPLSIPNFEGNEQKYVEDAINKGWVSTGGSYIKRLEKNLAEFLHTHDVAACQSGTSALHLSLIDAGVGPGDMVIVPTVTFIAAVNPVKYQHAVPVFMDCDDSLCMDPKKLESFCQEECRLFEDKLVHKETGRHIKALVIVHVFGNMADMESVMRIAEKYHIKVVEDATEALGTYYTEGKFAGKYAGTIGDYGCFSFNGNKIITTGGGGAVTAASSEAVEHMRYLSTQAKDDPLYYVHNEIGYNYRMTNIQAALGVAQMEELKEFIRRKNSNYILYEQFFKNFKLASIAGFREGTCSNKWFYSLEISMEKIQGTMKDIITRLEKKGVQTRAIWGLIHEQFPYRYETVYKIEKASYYSKRILNIPSSTQLTEEDIKYSANAVKEVLEELSR